MVENTYSSFATVGVAWFLVQGWGQVWGLYRLFCLFSAVRALKTLKPRPCWSRCPDWWNPIKPYPWHVPFLKWSLVMIPGWNRPFWTRAPPVQLFFREFRLGQQTSGQPHNLKTTVGLVVTTCARGDPFPDTLVEKGPKLGLRFCKPCRIFFCEGVPSTSGQNCWVKFRGLLCVSLALLTSQIWNHTHWDQHALIGQHNETLWWSAIGTAIGRGCFNNGPPFMWW